MRSGRIFRALVSAVAQGAAAVFSETDGLTVPCSRDRDRDTGTLQHDLHISIEAVAIDNKLRLTLFQYHRKDVKAIFRGNCPLNNRYSMYFVAILWYQVLNLRDHFADINHARARGACSMSVHGMGSFGIGERGEKTDA